MMGLKEAKFIILSKTKKIIDKKYKLESRLCLISLYFYLNVIYGFLKQEMKNESLEKPFEA